MRLNDVLAHNSLNDVLALVTYSLPSYSLIGLGPIFLVSCHGLLFAGLGARLGKTGGRRAARGGRVMQTFFMFGTYSEEALDNVSAKRT
ncbi:MAG: hypothetical protein NTU83_01915, partial [Candidatus Hydrogenedentes bacterium]|nr:hypothetical protein [Candidatus Hydrogenedentota bacterium]